MAVIDELPGGEDGRDELGAVDHRVQAALQQADQHLAGVAAHTLGFAIDLAELLFGDVAVVHAQLLLRDQLQTEVRGFALAALAVLAGAVLALVLRALRAAPKVVADTAVDFVLGTLALRHSQFPYRFKVLH